MGKRCLTALALVLTALMGWSASLPPGWADAPQSSLPAASPFVLGEKLTYDIEWSPPWYLFFLPAMHAGEVTLLIASVDSVPAAEKLKIVFTARSSGTLAKLTGVSVDDYFEAWSDPQTLCTFKVSKRIREGKRKRDIDVAYDPERNRLHIREINVAANPHKVDRDEFVEDIPACVRDIFSALYFVRRQQLNPGASHRSVVGDDDKVREVEARIEKKESVKTPAGHYEAWKISTVALLGGLFKGGGQFRIWMTADERKLPVKFEVNVSLGKAVGKLTAMEPAISADEDRSQP